MQDVGQVLLLHQPDDRNIYETAAQLPCAGCTPWGWCRRPAMPDPQRAHSHMNKHRCHICSRTRCAGNAAKQKSLHALGLVPAAAMLDRSALTAEPADATASPYEAAAARRKRSAASVADETLGEVFCLWFSGSQGSCHCAAQSARQQTWRIEACRL